MEIMNSFKGEWKKIVTKWADMNVSYLDAHDDFPAWYVENANTALFSAAAWACGAMCICEVDAEKSRYGQNSDTMEKYTGRFDLELRLKKASYRLEAKRRNIHLPASGGYTKYIKKAIFDTQKLGAYADSIEFQLGAVVFFVGSISSDQKIRTLKKNLQSQKIGELVEAEALRFKKEFEKINIEKYNLVGAALFQTSTDLLLKRKENWIGYDWPAIFGVAVIGRDSRS